MNIYVGNLSYKTTDDELRQVFEKYGTVTSARVIADKMSGQSRGFGFVEMPDQAQAQTAIQQSNGLDFQGRPLRVNESRPRTEGGGGGGGRDDFRGGGRRDRE